MTDGPLSGWRLLGRGKVRDLYAPEDGGDAVLLLVASDRVSAFDRVLEPEIPGKGRLLTRLSAWWLDRFPDVPNHVAAEARPVPDTVAGRAVVVRRLHMHPVECVVRGHLTGSGYAEYRATGSVSGVRLPSGLEDGDRLADPIFTPAFKAEQGAHDENIAFDRVVELVGGATAEALRTRSLALFAAARTLAEARGLILADTKFEFGADPATGDPVLADEVLTSDSSRYWDADAVAAGQRGVSFDKQIVRDWLREHWNGEGEPPRLPDEIVSRTAERYAALLERLGVPAV